MNIHVIYNEGQQTLFEKCFSGSIVDDWKIICHKDSQPLAQDYGTPAFAQIIHRKVLILINEILPSELSNAFFILSDVDIQFFKSSHGLVAASIEGKDIVFQSEKCPSRKIVNTGFIAMRSNANTLAFWKNVESKLQQTLAKKHFIEEQRIVNQMLPHCSQVKWGIFPSEIWAWSNPDFSPSQPSFSRICLHHANGTVPTASKNSLRLKMEQLQLVAMAYRYWTT